MDAVVRVEVEDVGGGVVRFVFGDVGGGDVVGEMFPCVIRRGLGSVCSRSGERSWLTLAGGLCSRGGHSGRYRDR